MTHYETELSKTYREGSWTVRQLVHHIADSQLNMYQRLKLALTDDVPTIPGFIQDEWAIQPDTELLRREFHQNAGRYEYTPRVPGTRSLTGAQLTGILFMKRMVR